MNPATYNSLAYQIQACVYLLFHICCFFCFKEPSAVVGRPVSEKQRKMAEGCFYPEIYVE